MALMLCASAVAQGQKADGSNQVPVKIHLIPDNYHLKNVGTLSDGRLYWIDVQLSYDHAAGDTRDFVCMYIFSEDGHLVDHTITDLGLRSSSALKASEVIRQMVATQSKPTLRDIWVHPFAAEHLGLTFGLIIRDEGDTGPVVDVLPGMTLMFYPPWPEGGYDT